jgi:hypothetical protein
MRLCSKCKIEIEAEIKKGCRCKNCNKNYMTLYRENNKEKIRLLNKNWRQNNKEYNNKTKYEYYSSLKGRLVEINRQAKRRSKKRNLEFDLNLNYLEELWNLQEGKCAVTNLPMIISQERNEGKATPFTPSLDRISFEKGYTKDNVRFVCYVVNCALHDYGIDVFNRIANAFINKTILPYEQKIPDIKEKSAKSKSDKKYNESFIGTVGALYRQSKKNSSERNIDFNLSREFVERLMAQKTCSLTKIPFDYTLLGNNRSNPFRPSIDRIDNSIGYVEDNVRIVCVAVNFCLNEFGEEVFKNICESYLRNKA